MSTYTPPLVHCPYCLMNYYQTSAAHVCAPPGLIKGDEVIAVLEQRRAAYDESIFAPVDNEETRTVHRSAPGLVDRISAQMARHVIDKLIEDLKQ